MMSLAWFSLAPSSVSLPLGLSDLLADPSLLPLEGSDVDCLRVVGPEQLLPLVRELAEPPPQEDGRLCPVALTLGDLSPQDPYVALVHHVHLRL